ncbi:MAG: hypothetical protein IIZ83_06960 [Oscillospiraceae bacterium]|nr:hypothetical protein [Oscillospiraceae bacterium]
MSEVQFDDLPELGTKAAAVAGIESLIHHAIGGNKICTPVQLRYWLDAYYQARKAAELQDYYTLVDRVYMEDATPHQSPPATASPQGEAQQFVTIREEDLEDGAPMSEIIERELRRLAKGAGIEIEEGEKPREEIQVDQFGFEKEGAESGPEAAAETQQKTEPAAKPQRQRPVGWTDGNQLPTDPETYSGAAAAAKFKREQFERLQRFLREGVTMQRIVKAAEGNINEDQILRIRECKRVPVAVYRVLEAALDRIETE